MEFSDDQIRHVIEFDGPRGRLHMRPTDDLAKFSQEIESTNPGVATYLDVGGEGTVPLHERDIDELQFEHSASSILALMTVGASYGGGDTKLQYMLVGPKETVEGLVESVSRRLRAFVAEWDEGKYDELKRGRDDRFM